MKELKGSTPKLDGYDTLLQPHQANLRRGGNHLKNGGRHGVGMDIDFSQCQGVSLSGNEDALVIDGVCKHYTKPTHTSHSRTRDFSRVAQDLSHRGNRNRCVSQNSHSSPVAQHVARTLVVVSFALELYLASYVHSSPTIYQTFVAVHLTRRFTLRGSIECVFRHPG